MGGISIVLPVFNERENINKQIEEIESKVKTKFEILIIYDFDQDDTIPIVKRAQKKFKNVKLLKNT